MDPGNSTRQVGAGVNPEDHYDKYEALKEEYESLLKRYTDLVSSHSGNLNKLELSQDEASRCKKLYEDSLQETNNAIRERNGLKQQCTAAIRQWDSALRERNEYKEALGKVQASHEEAMKEINQAMAVRIKSNKDLKKLSEERDAALHEYSLIMSERSSVHRELEKLTDDLTQAKKQIKNLENQKKEAVQEADVSKRRRDWAFNERDLVLIERDKIVRERESLRTLCDRLRRERDRAVSDLAEALSESEDIKKQKNLAFNQLKELKEKMDVDKENRSMRFHYNFSGSSSFSESRDSAIDSDMLSGHYSIKLPNMRGTDHGLILEPGVYISRIQPGSPASKYNLNVGDRVIYINDTPIDNVQDAILALNEDIDPIMITLSRSAIQLSSPISNTLDIKSIGQMSQKAQQLKQQQQLRNNSASNSSLKSDPSDPSGHNSNKNNSNLSGRLRHGGGLRDIFRVKLQKKITPNEEDVLATLDNAIDSAGIDISVSQQQQQQQQQKHNTNSGGSTGGSGAGTTKKNRKKRSSRNSSSNAENSINKNGTWPRNSRNSNCSYTLPHNYNNSSAVIGLAGELSEYSSSRGFALRENNSRPESIYYSGQGHYMPSSNVAPSHSSGGSNTVCIRRPGSGGKERIPISSIWDLGHQAKSVGSIHHSVNNSDSKNVYGVTTRMGNSNSSNNGLPPPPPTHRYSLYDQNYGKISKMPERNSVVPTFSDGSSIDFSVKSGNMEILEYYVKRMVKNQNSSESDNLDKVVTPPSLAMTHGSSGGVGGSNVLGHSSTSPLNSSNTLDRYFPYSSGIHNHENILPISMQSKLNPNHNSGAMSMPIQNIQKSNNSFSFEPTYSHHSHSHHEPSASSASMTLNSANKMSLFRNSDDFLLNTNYHYPIESSGTFPRKREPQRIRIPSNQSVTSRSSMEKFDLRNSPNPTYHIEVLDPGNQQQRSVNSSDFSTWPRKPSGSDQKLQNHKIRKYTIENKSTQPLGIQIQCKSNGGGVFVSSISQNSLAEEVGLQIGDRLLEVCGINMRSATYQLAANVLRNCIGDSITMLVQYSPEKYKEYKGVYQDGSSDESHSGEDEGSSGDDDDDENNSSISDSGGSRSGSPTPCNSPQSTLQRRSNSQKGLRSSSHSHHSQIVQQQQQQQQNSQNQNSGGNGGAGTFERKNISTNIANNSIGSNTSGGGEKSQTGGDSNVLLRNQDGKILIEKPRFLTLQLMKNSSNLGICLVGGNIVGIFIHSVQSGSIADNSGLRTGDQILEYNGSDLRYATAEEAAFELAKPLENVGVLIQYNLQRYNEIKDKPGDGFYVRALFDHNSLPDRGITGISGATSGESIINFHKDEILYVDNTMFNGKPGKWRAWKVDSDGHRKSWGLIPSKFKVEEEMMFKRTLGDLESDRRSSTISRRSFFRRKSHHRSSSRELASFSDFSMNSYGDLPNQLGGIQIKEDGVVLNSYQRVERLDHNMMFLRPVLILGVFGDLIAEKLQQDFPYQFGRVSPEIMHCSGQMLENGLKENIIIDYKRKGSHYECITMASIKNISSKKLYCIMDISTAGVERLQSSQLYPIVILVKFKSAKQIREIKDARCDKDKVKAKELYELSVKVESEYKRFITTSISGGTNISYMASQIKRCCEEEQNKTIWVPV